MLDTFQSHHLLRRLLDVLPLAPKGDDLKTVIVIQVDVKGRFDNIREFVLDVGQRVHKPSLVMGVDHRDNTEPVTLDVTHPLVVDYVVSDSVPDPLRPGGVAPIFYDAVKPG